MADMSQSVRPQITDEMVAAGAAAVTDQLDSGYRGHWCAEWQRPEGGCVQCRAIATAVLTAALEKI